MCLLEMLGAENCLSCRTKKKEERLCQRWKNPIVWRPNSDLAKPPEVSNYFDFTLAKITPNSDLVSQSSAQNFIYSRFLLKEQYKCFSGE